MVLPNLFRKMLLSIFVYAFYLTLANGAYNHGRNPFDCGPYGFICENSYRLRLCEGSTLYGPNFLCPANTLCNEDSSDVCEDAVNYIDPSLRGILKCRRNERIADPTVPGCKGYILCVPTKNKFQAIKFKCSGNTIFNGVSRTCSSPDKYVCPLTNSSLISQEVDRRSDVVDVEYNSNENAPTNHRWRPIDCKNYKFSVHREGTKTGRVAYFCPKRPVPGHTVTRCTVFSNHFCLTLQRDDEDQFAVGSGMARRRPRPVELF